MPVTRITTKDGRATGVVLEGGEEIQFKDGRVTNAKFASYRVPRFRDLPKADILLLDRKDLDPIGAGETPLIAVAPAMANAVFDATGNRIYSMPFRVPEETR